MHDTDRRVKYTRMVLRESLMGLLQEKPIGRVSVTEICKASQLNRGTFYAHYADPYELLEQIESDMYRELEEVLGQDVAGGDIDESLRNIMGVLWKNRDMCRVILGDNGNPQFIERILGMARTFFMERWGCREGMHRDTADYVYRYLSAGSVDVIRYWLLSDGERPLEDVTRIISDLCKGIIGASLVWTRT